MAGRGRDFLDAGKVAAVRRLLRQGTIVGGRRVRLSQRAIARQVGVSHTSVQAIAGGRWGVPCSNAARAKAAGEAVKLPKARRCNGCGYKIKVWPCVFCASGGSSRKDAGGRVSSAAAAPMGGRNYRRRGRNLRGG